MEDKKGLLKALPKVDECLKDIAKLIADDVPLVVQKKVIQQSIEQERQRILENSSSCRVYSPDEWAQRFLDAIAVKMGSNLKRLINGSGIIIHTNLGRSLLSQNALAALAQAGGHYSNLEFNLQEGKRGSRYSLVEEIICDLTGAEAALVVNNNAAAVLLSLDTFAKGKEVVVSRGQLVEIGGSFRVPDIMEKSGGIMVEVGTTNRTHLRDYENAITPETSLLLKVHTSNYRLIGFTSEVDAADMVRLARDNGLLVMEDLGSGCLFDLSPYGYPKEPTVQEVVEAGVDVVTFSGDKLLGGPQAGIIVGKRDVIEQIKKNPLNRALRVDKFTLASLEQTLKAYYDKELVLKEIPTVAMLCRSAAEVKKMAQRILRKLKKSISSQCAVQLTPTVSMVGGGSIPEYSIESWALELHPHSIGVSRLERDFRHLEVPIIGRIENERFLLDIRTVQECDVAVLCRQLVSYFCSEK